MTALCFVVTIRSSSGLIGAGARGAGAGAGISWAATAAIPPSKTRDKSRRNWRKGRTSFGKAAGAAPYAYQKEAREGNPSVHRDDLHLPIIPVVQHGQPGAGVGLLRL